VRCFAAWSAAYATASLTLLAQTSGTIQDHLDRAKSAAGSQWSQAANYFCAEDSVANGPTDPAIEPTRLFDNLSVIGSVGTAVYVIQTSEGMILIDAGYPDQTESVVLPGLKALGLDPAKVRYVIVTHGHSDHFGAARYFQDTYQAKVFLSAADWDLVENPQAGRGPAGQGPAGQGPAGKGGPPKGNANAAQLPRRDQVVMDGQPITLGDTKVLPVLVPGHTPGALALIFTVFDHGTKHTAGLFGGTVLTPGFVTADGLRDYVKSVQKYARIAADNHVEVEVQNHPLMDGFATKLDLLKNRSAQAPHPFVVGEQAYAGFLTVMSECAQAQLIRKGN